LGKPWLFAQIQAGLAQQPGPPQPNPQEMQDLLNEHLTELHAFYGEYAGVRIARKHIGWYAKNWGLAGSAPLQSIFAADDAKQQIRLAQTLFN
jgi:tRNA-dihydrouridine synthase B